MNTKDITELRDVFKAKPSEELLNIWSQNDRQAWRVEAFEAIRQILAERGVTIPSQHDHIPLTSVEPQRVVVTDIRMGFWSMVIFMVKWVIAAIPAFIILWLISMALRAIFAGIMVEVLR